MPLFLQKVRASLKVVKFVNSMLKLQFDCLISLFFSVSSLSCVLHNIDVFDIEWCVCGSGEI